MSTPEEKHTGVPPVIKHWRLLRKLGAGSFGEIYLGIHSQTSQQVAVKLESIRTKHPQLLWEAKMYRYVSGGQGMSHVYWYGTEGEFNALVLDYLGPSLEDLFNLCDRQFSLKTTLIIAQQMICRLEHTHNQRCIHRDLKPDNFLVGRPGTQKEHIIYLIDFGLAKRYVDLRGNHIPYREGKSLTGTARYASIPTHLGAEQGRRDDIEGLAYVLLYFLRGSLPWQGLKVAEKKDKYEKIMQKKVETSIDVLCKNLPPEFGKFLSYGRKLKFDERPDYAFLKKLLADVWRREAFCLDMLFDWTPHLKCVDGNKPAKSKKILPLTDGKITRPPVAPVPAVQISNDNRQSIHNNTIKHQQTQGGVESKKVSLPLPRTLGTTSNHRSQSNNHNNIRSHSNNISSSTVRARPSGGNDSSAKTASKISHRLAMPTGSLVLPAMEDTAGQETKGDFCQESHQLKQSHRGRHDNDRGKSGGLMLANSNNNKPFRVKPNDLVRETQWTVRPSDLSKSPNTINDDKEDSDRKCGMNVLARSARAHAVVVSSRGELSSVPSTEDMRMLKSHQSARLQTKQSGLTTAAPQLLSLSSNARAPTEERNAERLDNHNKHNNPPAYRKQVSGRATAANAMTSNGDPAVDPSTSIPQHQQQSLNPKHHRSHAYDIGIGTPEDEPSRWPLEGRHGVLTRSQARNR